MPKKGTSSPPIVFISHSHKDRHAATDLQTTMAKQGAETYLDQERISPGDHLPERIRDLITSCDTFLLIWSVSAASSTWVRREWNMAYELRKKIVPYCLDRTPLPPSLENLVYIDSKDRQLGDAQLLTAILPDFAPDPNTLFPGHWRASVNVFGMVQATYDLELRANGQVEGEGGVSQSGVAGPLADQMGMGGLLTMCVPFHGSWSYDQGTQVLTLETSVSAFGPQQRETIKIRTTGREEGAISGQDIAGRTWTLWRVAAAGDVSATPSSVKPVRESKKEPVSSDVYAVSVPEEANQMAELYQNWQAVRGEGDPELGS